MKPKSFDIDTAKEIFGDSRMRTIEEKARHDADSGIMDAPKQVKGTYWDGIQSDMDYIVYIHAHHKRTQRMQRIQEKA